MEPLTDKRRTYTFYVDDAVLDVFGPQIGAYGVAVYALLARHAKHKQAFPSYKIIQQKLGIGRMTVVRTLTALEKAGLITIETRRSQVGDYDSKLYTLCDLSSFRGGGTCEGPPGTCEGPPGTCEGPPGTCEVPGVVPVRYQGGTCEVPEGISFKESHFEGSKTPPYSPPEGDGPAIVENQQAGGEGKTLRPQPSYPPGFVQFWDKYPPARRASKPSCLQLWQTAHLEERTAEVCAKVEGLKHTVWQGKEPHFIPMTLTWLRQGRYEDEPITPPATPGLWAWARELEEHQHARQ